MPECHVPDCATCLLEKPKADAERFAEAIRVGQSMRGQRQVRPKRRSLRIEFWLAWYRLERWVLINQGTILTVVLTATAIGLGLFLGWAVTGR